MATATARRSDATSRNSPSSGKASTAATARCAARSQAASETVVTTNLRRQGIRVVKIKRQTFRGGRKVNEKDITFFTRQLATMLKAGVPLLQSFEIVARGHSNARFSRLMMDIKSKIEAGSSMSQAFREHPGAFRRALLQPGRRRRGVGHDRRDPRPARDVQGKDPRDQGQDQVGAVLPDLGDRGRDRRDRGSSWSS